MIEFLAWLEKVEPEMAEAAEILKERLSDNLAILYEQLTLIESWQGRILTILAEANAQLDLAEQQQLMSKSSDLTELDRRTQQRAATAPQRRIRDIAEGLAKSIQTRIILGCNLRRNAVGESQAMAT